MITDRDQKDRLSWRERLVATLVVAGLALPFVPAPGDGMAHMKVVRQSEDSVTPVKFTTKAPMNVCQVLAFTLEFENPQTGAYTRVACHEPAQPRG